MVVWIAFIRSIPSFISQHIKWQVWPLRLFLLNLVNNHCVLFWLLLPLCRMLVSFRKQSLVCTCRCCRLSACCDVMSSCTHILKCTQLVDDAICKEDHRGIEHSIRFPLVTPSGQNINLEHNLTGRLPLKACEPTESELPCLMADQGGLCLTTNFMQQMAKSAVLRKQTGFRHLSQAHVLILQITVVSLFMLQHIVRAFEERHGSFSPRLWESLPADSLTLKQRMRKLVNQKADVALSLLS